MNVQITINGRRTFVQDGMTLIEAARQAGVYIPHFCYHPKLSVAANCRMCLVQVDKMPKPVPACATMVTDGMSMRTDSESTKNAQKGVMEFLLINHPLDCPICDQGGECQLQDLAVGYGVAGSRFGESKRVVVEKRLGPLITTVMNRCIHCTRCVRFGEEIAERTELGLCGRGEHSEIMPFLGKTVDSELSGNLVDVCPVGALNSKPFQFSARSWELDRVPGIAQHDAWGSRTTVQTVHRKVMRVIPRETEDINECWLSDRDRHSGAGLDVPGRLRVPQMLDAGARKWRRAEWHEALAGAAAGIRRITDRHGPDQLGFLISPQLVSEISLLAQNMARGLGCPNIDCRLRQTDFSLDGVEKGVAWMGTSISRLEMLRRVLLVGCNPGMELPLLPLRLRRLVREHGGRLHSLGSRDLSGSLPLAGQLLARPSQLHAQLSRIAAEFAGRRRKPKKGGALPAEKDTVGQIASSLAEQPGKTAILLGAEAMNSRYYGLLRRTAARAAGLCGGFHGLLVNESNVVGAQLAGATPHHGFMGRQVREIGLNAFEMLGRKLKGYVLVGCEPLDFADARLAREAFQQAETVVSLTAYASPSETYSNMMLPIAFASEAQGAQVNLEGDAHTCLAAADPPGEARHAWKILREIGSQLGLGGHFKHETFAMLRSDLIAAGDYAKLIDNSLLDNAELQPDSVLTPVGPASAASGEFERLAETAHFGTDPLVRASAPLQKTAIARASRMARFHPDDLAGLGLAAGEKIALSDAGGAEIVVDAGEDATLARGTVSAPRGQEVFAPLGAETLVRARVARVISEAGQKAA